MTDEFRPTRFEIFVDGESLGFRFPDFGKAFQEITRQIDSYRAAGHRCFDTSGTRTSFLIDDKIVVEIKRTGTLLESDFYAWL